jgi:hypothetical protein
VWSGEEMGRRRRAGEREEMREGHRKGEVGGEG